MMIDEKKLIEEIEYMIGMLPTYYINKKDEENAYLDAINRVLSAVKRQPKVGEWIPVEEGLPEEHEIVDITYVSEIYEYKDDGDIFYIERVTSTAYYKDEKWFDEYDEYILEDVIAWKPRPEPYRKEDNK